MWRRAFRVITTSKQEHHRTPLTVKLENIAITHLHCPRDVIWYMNEKKEKKKKDGKKKKKRKKKDGWSSTLMIGSVTSYKSHYTIKKKY
jgi:hypothetical protein